MKLFKTLPDAKTTYLAGKELLLEFFFFIPPFNEGLPQLAYFRLKHRADNIAGVRIIHFSNLFSDPKSLGTWFTYNGRTYLFISKTLAVSLDTTKAC
jgi:hypothetical protein